MKKIREVLLNEYIGAIAIGVILASAITGLTSALFFPLAHYVESRFGYRPSSVFGSYQPPQFPWEILITGLIPIGLDFLAAYWLLRWLYLRPKNAQPEHDGTQEPASHPNETGER